MAKIGYARVGPHGQSDDSQVDELNGYGVDMRWRERDINA
jgi:DNA invertase Pin-like site-specific DNA recombinase